MTDLTEEECRLILKFLIERERRRFETAMKPFIYEYVELERRQPPRPVHLPDGRTFIYSGPTATQIGGEYKPPRYLVEIIEEDRELNHELRLYRNSRRYNEQPE